MDSFRPDNYVVNLRIVAGWAIFNSIFSSCRCSNRRFDRTIVISETLEVHSSIARGLKYSDKDSIGFASKDPSFFSHIFKDRHEEELM